MKHIIITGFLTISLCLTCVQGEALPRTSNSANPAKVKQLNEILPEGKYHLLFSPARPDLENRNVVPEILNVEISYKDGEALLTLDKKSIAVTFSDGEVIFTLPSGIPGAKVTGVTVFSGRSWSDETPGRIVGRMWQIRGSRSPIEEQLSCLQLIK